MDKDEHQRFTDVGKATDGQKLKTIFHALLSLLFFC